MQEMPQCHSHRGKKIKLDKYLSTAEVLHTNHQPENSEETLQGKEMKRFCLKYAFDEQSE